MSCRGSEGPHTGLRQLPWGRGEAPGGAAWPGGCARHGVRIPGSSSVPTWLWLEHNSGMELGKMVMCGIASGAGAIDSSEPVGLTCHRAFGHGSQSHARGPEPPLPQRTLPPLRNSKFHIWMFLTVPQEVTGFTMEKTRTLTPESCGAFQQTDSCKPRLLHLPTQRKALNLLTSLFLILEIVSTWYSCCFVFYVEPL